MDGPLIHRTAAEGFERAADAYERARPDYPDAAVDFAVEALGVRAGDRVLDIGAGTGKLTAALIARGLRCTALEPVEGMRAHLRAAVPQADVIDGAAEAIPLPDESMDGVTVAQAFHWFDAERATREIARVLRPGRRMALVWNVRDERHDWVRRITEIIQPYEGSDGVSIPRYRHGVWRDGVARAGAVSALERREFEHAQPMTPDLLVDRVASTSFISILAADRRAAVLEKVARLAAEHPDLAGRARFAFPYVTEVYLYQRA